MALLGEAEDIESGTRQSSAMVPDENRKSADVRTKNAQADVNARGDATPRGNAVADTLMRRIPQPIQSRWNAVVEWLQGPEPPQLWKIRPFLPRLQQLPLRLVDKFFPRQWQRIAALFVFYICWIVTFGAVLHESSIVDDVDGYGSPVLLDCGTSFWYGFSTMIRHTLPCMC